MRTLSGSGINVISEASMPFHPPMDEPPKKWPSVNLD